MNKPANLRQTLETALPWLQADPERLIMFIEEGKIAATLGRPSFEYQYTLTIGLLDYADHPDQVMIPLLDWLRTHEPSLLQNPDKQMAAIRFEAEILNNQSYDLRIQIQLSERVKVTQIEGNWHAEHLPEPTLPQ